MSNILTDKELAELIEATSGNKNTDGTFDQEEDDLLKEIEQALTEAEEDLILAELEDLEEASVIKMDAKAKFSAKVTNKAIELASKAKDPLAEKYRKMIALKEKLQSKLLARYKAKAIMAIKQEK